MASIRSLLLHACVSITSIGAVNLYVAASDGNITTLSLSESKHVYNLSVTSVTPECQANPSWLTLDHENRILYCLDRGSTTSTNGSLNSFSIGKHGNLTRRDRVDAPLSGVYAGIFGEETRGFATVS
jgi:6-phosphogluconolactonase (cycloisomerase 2 family)